MNRIKLARMDCEKVSGEIGDFVIEQVRCTEMTGCVVGLSGGVDSSATAALIRRRSRIEALRAAVPRAAQAAWRMNPRRVCRTEGFWAISYFWMVKSGETTIR